MFLGNSCVNLYVICMPLERYYALSNSRYNYLFCAKAQSAPPPGERVVDVPLVGYYIHFNFTVEMAAIENKHDETVKNK